MRTVLWQRARLCCTVRSGGVPINCITPSFHLQGLTSTRLLTMSSPRAAKRQKIEKLPAKQSPVKLDKGKQKAAPSTHGATSQLDAQDATDGVRVSRTDHTDCPQDQLEWPAPPEALLNATRFLKEAIAYLKSDRADKRPLLIVPDKDADGLSAGQILQRTLLHAGVPQDLLRVHLMAKGNSPQSSSEKTSIAAYDAAYIVVLDQGSRHGAGITQASEDGWDNDQCRSKAMVLDHHFIEPGHGPKGALMVSAAHHYPIATSALLTWVLCRPLWRRPDQPLEATAHTHTGADFPRIEASAAIDYLCLLGTMGDLSVNVAWDPPWPDFSAQIKQIGKSNLSKAISLVNAPRRTPAFDASAAWRALSYSRDVQDLLSIPAKRTNPSPAADRTARSEASTAILRLFEARNDVFQETERATHTPPKFSKDGRVALLRIRSAFQVHPGIATRWSGTLKGAKKLQVVMCANEGYSTRARRPRAGESAEDAPRDPVKMVHFSCRRAKAALDRGEDVNIIEILKDYAARDPSFLPDLDRNYAEELEGAEEEADDAGPAPSQASAGSGSGEGGGSNNFAKGHREASGGIMPLAFFERFCDLMQIGVKPSPEPDAAASPKKSSKKQPVQKTTLAQFFGKKEPAKTGAGAE